MDSLTSNQNKRVNYFSLLKSVLKVLGISITGNESFKFRMYSTICFSIATIFLIFHIIEIFKHEMEVIVQTLMYQFAAFMSYAKAIVVLKKRLKVKKLLDSLEHEPFLPDPKRGEGEQKLTDKCVWITDIQARVYLTGAGASLFIGTITSLTKRIKSNDYHDWEFSYGPITVLNVTYSPNYELSWLFQTLSMNFLGFHFIVTDIITATILVHISYQFKLLQNYIRNIVSTTYKRMEKDGIKMCSEEGQVSEEKNILIPWKYLKESLKNIVEYHLKILDIANEVETMFNSLLLLVAVSTIALLAVLVFRVSTLSFTNDRFLRTSMETTCASVQIMIICFWGEQVLQESKLVGNAAYEADFVGTDLRFQKGLAFIMRRSQNPTVITANKYATICLATFTWIMQKSYSSYMVLQHSNSHNI